MKTYYVYIMSNKSRRLYTGITRRLMARVREHKDKAIPGFTARYNFDTLVHYEGFSHPLTAIKREKKSKAGFGKKIETHLGIESRLGGPEQRMG